MKSPCVADKSSCLSCTKFEHHASLIGAPRVAPAECGNLGAIVAHVCTHCTAVFMQTYVHTGNATPLNSTTHAIFVAKFFPSHHRMQHEISHLTQSYRDQGRRMIVCRCRNPEMDRLSAISIFQTQATLRNVFKARQGKARQGKARQGKARQGRKNESLSI